MASLALGVSTIDITHAEELCSITPQSYTKAKTDYPDLAFAISAVEEYSIAAWYTDRLSTADRARMLKDLTTQCSEDTRMTVVVYGIPKKDCNAGFSSGGTVSNTADYKTFLSDLTTAVGNRKVLNVVEPDSVGLLAEENGCGVGAGYLENLKVAVKALSKNKNAELYVDVGYWTLEYEAQSSKVVKVMKELAGEGKLKGITINTSNYRSTDQMTKLCTKFQTAMGSTDMTCIVDTSRNFNEPATTDWCNIMGAGIGQPPTSETNITNLDYFMWVKVPGESDGTCSDGSEAGPTAGFFFEAGFQHLWDQGYLVKKLGMNTIADGGSASQTLKTGVSQTSSHTSASESIDDDSVSEPTDKSSSEESEEPKKEEDEEPQPHDGSASQRTAQTEPSGSTDTKDETEDKIEDESETLPSSTTESSPSLESEVAPISTPAVIPDTTPSAVESPLKTAKCTVKSRFRQ